MNKNLVKKIVDNISAIESIETRKFLARGFIKQGMNKSRAYELMKDKSLFNSATEQELLVFAYELNKLCDEKIDIKKSFSKNTIEEFNSTKVLDEFIPINYDDENYFEKNKLEFVNDCYSNENTKRTFWHLYKSIIQNYEKKFNKDLCRFNVFEIEEMIKGISSALTTKRNIISFIQIYNDWCVENEIVDSNNLSGIDIKTILSAPDVNKNSSYVSYEELYKNCMWLENKPDNDIIMLDVMIALLMRSGLRASDIVDMRYSDIDFETGYVKFDTEDMHIKRHLKKFVLKVIREVEDEVYLVGAAKRPLLKIDNHVVKVLDSSYDKDKVSKNIRKRMSKFKNVYRPLNENILINSLKFDDLNEIENNNGTVTIKDYKQIQEKYGNNANSYQKLREDYQIYKDSLNKLEA